MRNPLGNCYSAGIHVPHPHLIQLSIAGTMGLTGISEFTFGFAFLFEQTRRNWAGLRAVPVLPSLQAEADIGWDAHLPAAAVDFYYQFKLSDYLFAAHATFRKDKTYAGPYYRIALHKRNRNQQHRRLFRHARRHPETYYVAPELSEVGLFQNAFLAQEIVQRSRLIPLNRCRNIRDGQQHYLTYLEGDLISYSTPNRPARKVLARDLNWKQSIANQRGANESLTVPSRMIFLRAPEPQSSRRPKRNAILIS